MHSLKEIVANPEYFKKMLTHRNFEVKIVDDVLSIAEKRSSIISDAQKLEEIRNVKSKEISKLSNQEDRTKLIKEVQDIKNSLKNILVERKNIENQLEELMLLIPNLPFESIPVGKDENDNVVVKEFSNLNKGLIENVKPHYEIGVEQGFFDFKTSGILSGSRFWIYKNEASKLVRALENFLLDFNNERGYQELRLPVIVSSQTMTKTGQLPKFKDDLFKLEGIDQYLIPTSEVTLIGYFQNKILDLNKTISVTTFSQCFRKEAGAGGKDMKGIIRGHQFNKVELVKIATKENAMFEFENMVNDVESILFALDIPFRKVMLCTSDLGFSSQKTIDFEIWMPSEKKYREVSSVSIFGNFQGRRSMIRYRDENEQTQYAHTLNGSGLAIDRVLAAIIENYQDSKKQIQIPKVLQKYLHFDVIKSQEEQ